MFVRLVSESAGSQTYMWESTTTGYKPMFRRKVNWENGTVFATFEAGVLVSYVRD